jgi:hypothetical protein
MSFSQPCLQECGGVCESAAVPVPELCWKNVLVSLE